MNVPEIGRERAALEKDTLKKQETSPPVKMRPRYPSAI
jgi:hypothetical protein